MPLDALLLALAAAFLHAFWNLLVKQAKGGLPLLWVIFVWMVVVFSPREADLRPASNVGQSASAVFDAFRDGAHATLTRVKAQLAQEDRERAIRGPPALRR